MTITDRARHTRPLAVLTVVETVVAVTLVFFGYWELIAYAGPSAAFTLLPPADPSISRIYPGFGSSPGPSAAVFTIGLLLLAINLTRIRLMFQPGRGGKLVWLSLPIAAVGLISHFSGIVVAISGNDPILPEILIVGGALVLIAAACVAVCGVVLIIRGRARTTAASPS
jgi:hypothetical protein